MERTKETFLNDIAAKLARREDAHKGDFGHVMICAGSYGMAGAAVMCGLGALRSGAGLISYCADEKIINILQTSVPQAMVRPLPAGLLMQADSAAFGPGFLLSGAPELLSDLLSRYKGTLVIDAEGLNIIAREDMFDAVKKSSADIIITPHEGEAERLLLGADKPACGFVDDKDVKARCIKPGGNGGITDAGGEKCTDAGGEERTERRMKMINSLREKTGSTVLLKGSGTLVLSAEGLFENVSGNPGMATGGSGDVLTGIIAALAGQGLSAFEAASFGAYLHGYAGDLAAAKYGQCGMTALDIADMTGVALKEILGA